MHRYFLSSRNSSNYNYIARNSRIKSSISKSNNRIRNIAYLRHDYYHKPSTNQKVSNNINDIDNHQAVDFLTKNNASSWLTGISSNREKSGLCSGDIRNMNELRQRKINSSIYFSSISCCSFSSTSNGKDSDEEDINNNIDNDSDSSDGSEWIPPSRSPVYQKSQPIKSSLVDSIVKGSIDPTIKKQNSPDGLDDGNGLDADDDELRSLLSDLMDNDGDIWIENSDKKNMNVTDDDNYDENDDAIIKNMDSEDGWEDVEMDNQDDDNEVDNKYIDGDDDVMAVVERLDKISQRMLQQKQKKQQQQPSPSNVTTQGTPQKEVTEQKEGKCDFFEDDDTSGIETFLEQEEQSILNTNIDDSQLPDWNASRRRILDDSSSFLPPSKTAHRINHSKQKKRIIPVKKHTLLSSTEIITCLRSLGVGGNRNDSSNNVTTQHNHRHQKNRRRNPHLIIPKDPNLREGLGRWNGLIICTANSVGGYSDHHVRTLAQGIVDQLKARDLGSRGIVGARYGSEGGVMDGVDNKHTRRRIRKKGRESGTNVVGSGGTGGFGFGGPSSKSSMNDDEWTVVDCGNYVVHIFRDDDIRKAIDLEGLWEDNGRAGRELRSVDVSNDDEVDDYVMRNPVPDVYADSVTGRRGGDEVNHNGGGSWGGWEANSALDRMRKNIIKGRSTATSNNGGRWTPSNNQKRKTKNMGVKRGGWG